MDQHRAGVNAVVDTNVVAYHVLLTQPFVDEVKRFWRGAGDLLAPSHWEAELANTVWMGVKARLLSASEAEVRLDGASQLGIRTIPVRDLWKSALARALRFDVAVYDALFVELAVQQGLPLATFDRRLLTVFPDVARRPASLLVDV